MLSLITVSKFVSSKLISYHLQIRCVVDWPRRHSSAFSYFFLLFFPIFSPFLWLNFFSRCQAKNGWEVRHQIWQVFMRQKDTDRLHILIRPHSSKAKCHNCSLLIFQELNKMLRWSLTIWNRDFKRKVEMRINGHLVVQIFHEWYLNGVLTLHLSILNVKTQLRKFC